MPKPYDHTELSDALEQGHNLSIERLAATVRDLLPAAYANMGGNEIQSSEHSGEQLPDAEPRQKRPYNRKPKEEKEFDL